MTENMASRINWPAGFEPENSHIHAANEIEINAAPDLVWKRLIEAPRWPEYYPHASEIHLPAGEDALRSGIQFTWVTAENKLVTTVKEYVPNERIAWEAVLADDASSTAYHAWLITPTDGGCHVLTEETQQGPFWEELAKKMPDGLHHFHQEWVEKLAEVAETDAAKTS